MYTQMKTGSFKSSTFADGDRKVEQIVWLVSYALVIVVAVLGNSCVVYLVMSKEQLRSNLANYFIASMAVGDILMALVCLVLHYVSSVLLEYWPLGKVACRVFRYIQVVIDMQKAHTLIGMSLERYIAIVHPFLRRLDKRDCLQVIVLCWMLAFLIAIPQAINAGVNFGDSDTGNMSNSLGGNITWADNRTVVTLGSSNFTGYGNTKGGNGATNGVIRVEEGDQDGNGNSGECEGILKNKKLGLSFRLTFITIQCFLPMIILIFTYARIIHVVWLIEIQHVVLGQQLLQSGQTSGEGQGRGISFVINQTEQQKKPHIRKKVIKMMISLVITYSVCWLPLHVIIILDVVHPSIWDWPHMRSVIRYASLLAMSSCMYNPFIYWWLNPKFREGYVYLFYRLVSCCQYFRYERGERACNLWRVLSSVQISQFASQMELNHILRHESNVGQMQRVKE